MEAKSSLTNMLLCLGVITLVCGAILAGVYVITQEPIAEAMQAKTEAAIASVCPSFQSLSEVQTSDGTSCYMAVNGDGAPVAYVVSATSDGFGGPLTLMVGFRPDGTIYNTAVLSHSETPGLGAKCTEETFSGQFKDFNPAVKKLSVIKDGGDVDAITASTITSRAYCAALEKAVKIFSLINIPVENAEEEIVQATVEEEDNDNE